MQYFYRILESFFSTSLLQLNIRLKSKKYLGKICFRSCMFQLEITSVRRSREEMLRVAPCGKKVQMLRGALSEGL